MVATSISVEIDSPVEATRLWKAIVKDYDLLPKQMPGVCSGVTRLQGDGGVGTVIQIDFTPVNKDFSYVKERMDEIDEENFYYKFSYVEGGELGTVWASAQFKLKLTPKAEGGCVLSHTCDYDSLPGVSIDQAKIQEMEGAATGLLKTVEAYLISNPTLYV
ncbi:hypothetical protein SUGI_0716310 [Cryptomeria japonica]|uniref:pathogenesis-related protein 1 n=1 Tax=Cryptomeria japonica TaxID=3369 RepID=UPI0024147E3B|nr:pathogenesis-related protein 1 [Cryptomeria japonica]GLJ35639.1 hypothetical protein SUGI_0716310 [Cryptomeria japonica]